MKLCVIIVVMNEEEGLHMTLLSLLPSASSIHKVVVKDGSKLRLIREKKINTRYSDLDIIYKHSPDSGIYDAMNQGILASPSCDYLWFLNAGDVLSNKSALKKALNDINGYKVLPDLCLFGWKVGGKVVRPWWLRSIITAKFRAHYGWVVRHQSVWFKYSVIKHNMYDTSYKIVADAKLIASIMIKKQSLVHLNQDIVLSHNDASGVCKTNIIQKEHEFQRVYSELHHCLCWSEIAKVKSHIRKLVFRLWKK